MWMKSTRKGLSDIDEGLVAEFVDKHLPGCHCPTSARHPTSLGAVVAALRGTFHWRATLGDRTQALVGALA